MRCFTRVRGPVAAAILAANGACGSAPQGRTPEGPPQERAYRAPAQDSLAAVIRTIRAGEEAVGPAAAVAAAARIPPEQLGEELRDAMTRALALSIGAEAIQVEDSVLMRLGAMLEEALGAVWSQADLTAAMREIPSETGSPTARQRVAARLANRLDAGEAGEDLRAAMAEAFTSVWGDHYPMHGVRDEVAAAWANQHSADKLAQFIRSITTGTERLEQAAAVHVVFYGRLPFHGRYWRRPTAGTDSTGITDPELRAALLEALAYVNEVENRRVRERNRLEAIGDRAGLDSLRAVERGRPAGHFYLHRTLAWAVRDMGDPATLDLLVRAPVDGLSLEPFGEAAVPTVLAAIADTAAGRDRIAALLSDLRWIARKHDLAAETREAVAAALQGFLTGETLRARRITDPWGSVLGAAIDLAVALGDSASLRRVHAFAADPAEMVRAGVSPRGANTLFSILRPKVGWTPPAMSEDEIAAELMTVPLSARPTVSQIDAAQLASLIDPDLVSEALRSAMVKAWEHARVAVNEHEWYFVLSQLEEGLCRSYDSATALAAIRAIPAGAYGPEQVHAVEFARRLRGDAGEDLRVAMIAALEHLNGVPVDEGSWSTSPVVALRSNLVYAVGGLEDPRSIPALARSGWGFTCNTHMVGSASVEVARETLIAIAREILAVIAEPGAPPRRVSAGLYDLAVLLMGNDLTRDIPDELVEEIVARARGYLDGSTMGGFATARRHHRFWIVRNAILLAAVIDDRGLVALVEGLAAGPEALAALGVTDPDDAREMRDHARAALGERPILAPGDC